MESYDVIVVGSGSGMMIADATVSRGMKVALVEMDKLGGTCLNRGCIPSKMVIYPADIVNQIKHAERLGVHAEIKRIDFEHIMRRTREFVEHDRRPMEESILRVEGLTYYPERGEFVDDYTMRVGDKLITAEHFFLVTGSRPLMEPMPVARSPGIRARRSASFRSSAWTVSVCWLAWGSKRMASA